MMVLGLSFLYCGTVDRRLSLQMAWLPLMTAALVGVQVSVLEQVDLNILLMKRSVVSLGLRHSVLELANIEHVLGRYRWDSLP